MCGKGLISSCDGHWSPGKAIMKSSRGAEKRHSSRRAQGRALASAVLESLETRLMLSSYVYSNDFANGTAGSEWSKQLVEGTPTGNNQFLGEFGGGNNAYLNGGFTWVPGRLGAGA